MSTLKFNLTNNDKYELIALGHAAAKTYLGDTTSIINKREETNKDSRGYLIGIGVSVIGFGLYCGIKMMQNS